VSIAVATDTTLEVARAYYHKVGIRCCTEADYLFWAKDAGSGYMEFCDDCPKKARKEMQARGLCPPLHEALVKIAVVKLCKRCGQVKQRSEFYKWACAKDGLFPHCKECERERKRVKK